MNDSKNSTALWGVVITTLGLIVIAVINNYDKIFKPPPDVAVEEPVAKDSTHISHPKPLPRPGSKPNSQTNPSSNAAATSNIITSIARGQVVDGNGNPITGAKIRCTDCLSSSQQVTTDENGNFSLPFQVERTHEIQDIHLAVSGRSQPYSVPVSDPTGLRFLPN